MNMKCRMEHNSRAGKEEERNNPSYVEFLIRAFLLRVRASEGMQAEPKQRDVESYAYTY